MGQQLMTFLSGLAKKKNQIYDRVYDQVHEQIGEQFFYAVWSDIYGGLWWQWENLGVKSTIRRVIKN